MTPISAEDLLAVLEHLETMDPEQELEPLIDRFAEEQPLLAAYLDDWGGEDFNDDEHEVLLFFGVALWHCVEKHSEGPLDEITDDTLERIQEENEELLEKISSEQGEISGLEVRGLLQNHPQFAMLNELFNVIIEEESENIRPKNLGELLLFLKIAADALVEEAAG